MFTGIVKAKGSITAVTPTGGDVRLSVRSGGLPWAEYATGDSISVNGVCLTIVELHGDGFDTDVSVETLAGLDEQPGDLAGFGPVLADIARQVAESSSNWTYVVHDEAGKPTATGSTRRRPSAQLRRQVEAAHPRCVFPGCRMPAQQCDVDHREPWADGGETTFANLAPLCRHDHRMRHEAGWSYSKDSDGDHEWVSLLGHRYAETPRGP